jgi:hypothetical protein
MLSGMGKRLRFVFLAIVAGLANAVFGQPTHTNNESIYVGKPPTNSSQSAESTARAKERAFKGMELYSWKDPSRGWIFALLPGTNRLKTEQEIKQKENEILGASQLEQHFSKLAEGEEVFWFHRDLSGFAYPDERVLQEIQASARKAKVELQLPQRH